MEIKGKVDPKRLVKITVASADLKVSRLAIYEMIKENELDHVIVSGSPIVVINEKYEQVKSR